MRYRNRPVEIDAFQYYDTMMRNSAPSWFVDATENGIVYYREGKVYIKTLEGEHLVSNGDYVIKGVKGELYPCKPEIFKMTYEPVL